MPFATADDEQSFLQLLRAHPEWRVAVRREILTEELLGVPVRLERVEGRLERVEGRLERVEGRLERVEAALAELAEAQARTEERLARLEEAQLRTEAAVERLAQAQLGTQRELGALTRLMGATAEEDAEVELENALARRGWRVLGRPHPLQIDGELDLAVQAEDPTGARFWVLVEAKVRVRRHEVGAWAQMLDRPTTQGQLRAAMLKGPYLAYIFGVRVYPDAEPLARELGIGVLTERGETVEPRERTL